MHIICHRVVHHTYEKIAKESSFQKSGAAVNSLTDREVGPGNGELGNSPSDLGDSGGSGDPNFTKPDWKFIFSVPMDFAAAFRLACEESDGGRRNVHVSVSGVEQQLPPHPGLIIEGYGTVGLPVNERVVEGMKSSFSQAPFGKGLETLVDTNVRNCWELGRDKYHFSNPLWEDSVQELAARSAMELGVAQSVEAVPYKLLLYEKGSFFLPHQDTEKEPGMFATMIIQLPSIYTGGELVVTLFDGKEEVCDMGSARYPSSHHIHFAMHYADLKHEIKPIESGIRLALSYSICFRGDVGPLPSLDSAVETMDAFRRVAALYRNEEVLWPLVHQYTEDGLIDKGIKGLKGPDSSLVCRISKAREILSPGKRFDILLVIAEKSDFYDNDCLWDTKQLSIVMDVEGVRLTSFPFDLGSTDWGSGHDTDEESYTGNAGPSLTTIYRTAFLLIVPEMSSSGGLERYGALGFIQYLGKQSLSNSNPEIVHQAIEVIQSQWDSFVSPNDLRQTLSVAIAMKNTDFG